MFSFLKIIGDYLEAEKERKRKEREKYEEEERAREKRETDLYFARLKRQREYEESLSPEELAEYKKKKADEEYQAAIDANNAACAAIFCNCD